MLGAILGAVITTAAKDVTGRVVGERFSKTKVGANAVGLTALWAILPGVFEGDPAAVGQVVILAVGWVTTLYGRWKADQG